jgi:hypothetical protein
VHLQENRGTWDCRKPPSAHTAPASIPKDTAITATLPWFSVRDVSPGLDLICWTTRVQNSNYSERPYPLVLD